MRRDIKTVAGAFFFLLASWAPAQAATVPPSAGGEAASALTPTDATLEAKIDPGSSAAGAYYQFQLSELPAEFADEIYCPPPPGSGPFLACIGPESAAALPIGHVPAGGESAVALDLATAGITLKPDTTYYFRVVAASAVQSEDTIEWEQPVVGGETMAFTTVLCPFASAGGGSGGFSGTQGAEPAPSGRHRRHHARRHSRAGVVAISRARIAY
jgi:hypothetical protein